MMPTSVPSCAMQVTSQVTSAFPPTDPGQAKTLKLCGAERCLEEVPAKHLQSEKVIPYDSNSMTLWNRKNHGDSKENHCEVITTGLEGTGEWIGGHRIFRRVKLLCTTLQWGMHVILHLSKLVECGTPRGSPNVNCGLG